MVLFSKELTIEETPIPGLRVVTLPVHGDSRGWFKENWQRAKMTELGLPDVEFVQQNISYNAYAGVTRGFHAELWDKYVSVATGCVFGAWVDLREGPSRGTVFTHEIDPSVAVFVPRGVANAFQVLEDGTAYTYLVTSHWSPTSKYIEVSIYDTSLGIEWPISLSEAIVSDKDTKNPTLADVTPIPPLKVMIVGADGQLGRALQDLYPEADLVTRDSFDITSIESVRSARDWSQYRLIINAAAYTNVDGAEDPANRSEVWAVNATAVANLAMVCNEHGVTLVHVSSDYVFDGKATVHTEDEGFAPLNVYGMSKAAGDVAASTARRHYIIRTSWVVGAGKNFVDTMAKLCNNGAKPSVINDQFGRLTFTSTLAGAIRHLVNSGSPFGTYNVTNGGDTASWYDIACEVYRLLNGNVADISGVTVEQYLVGKSGIAPRPAQSTLSLDKLQSTGFNPPDWRTMLAKHLSA